LASPVDSRTSGSGNSLPHRLTEGRQRDSTSSDRKREASQRPITIPNSRMVAGLEALIQEHGRLAKKATGAPWCDGALAPASRKRRRGFHRTIAGLSVPSPRPKNVSRACDTIKQLVAQVLVLGVGTVFGPCDSDCRPATWNSHTHRSTGCRFDTRGEIQATAASRATMSTFLWVGQTTAQHRGQSFTTARRGSARTLADINVTTIPPGSHRPIRRPSR